MGLGNMFPSGLEDYQCKHNLAALQDDGGDEVEVALVMLPQAHHHTFVVNVLKE